MSMLNGEGYGGSVEEKIEQAVDGTFPSKPGFGGVYQNERDLMRSEIYEKLGYSNDR